MKRFLLLGVFALLASITLSKTAIFATTAEEEDHGGDIYYTKPLKAVIFSHKAHTVDIGLQCEWCHDETFEMEALAMEAEENFDMDSLCNENYCGTCHNGDISFSTTTQCARCHIGRKGYDRLVREGVITPEEDEGETDEKDGAEGTISKFEVSRAEKRAAAKEEKDESLKNMVSSGYFPDDITLEAPQAKSTAVFSHKRHISREQLKCTECHPYVFLMKVDEKVVKQGLLNMEQMKKGKFCGNCHNGEKAFSVAKEKSCLRCHPN